MSYTNYTLAALIILAAAYLGATQALGAHPFWAMQIAWIGVPVGLIVALALAKLSKAKRLAIFAVALIAAGAAAHFGKMEFAASYAESEVAGRFWHFGWIATVAAATALLAVLLSPRRNG